MKKEYFIGSCPICKQGMLEILKEKKTGKLFISCDECEAEWKSPQDALSNQGATRFCYDLANSATSQEIEATGWSKYII